ncbi:MAG: response regulator transcription factor [Ignavibacteria bacterium]|jgi:two-component system response regulator NreC|nr:response regulator transcription factor [Ignavibacteria bacterium]MCU7503840.1 response regulator transcription factor [Ignavibacteria bacterium]MCU7515939.1 response regulator transcription factor [Ignavibacteria bacterium]
MISVLIADDHGLFRKGIIKILNDSGKCQVTGEAENGQELIKKYFILKPDVVLVDISMPGISGIDAFIEIMKMDKSVKALFLTMHDDEEYIYKIFKEGGRGLINKNYLEEDLFKIIQKVYKGEFCFGEKWSPDMMSQIKSSGFRESDSHKNRQYIDSLSEREREIFLLIGNGYSSTQIADKLSIAKRTVDTHRTHLYDKLGVNSFHGLFKLAVEFNISRRKEQ